MCARDHLRDTNGEGGNQERKGKALRLGAYLLLLPRRKDERLWSVMRVPWASCSSTRWYLARPHILYIHTYGQTPVLESGCELGSVHWARGVRERAVLGWMDGWVGG